MHESRTPRAYEYLMEAIATAWTERELDAFQRLAVAHYAGGRRDMLEEQIAVRRDSIARRPREENRLDERGKPVNRAEQTARQA